MKKFLSLLLAAMMIFSVLPTAALADGMKTLDMAPVGEVSTPAEEPAKEPVQETEQPAAPAEEPAAEENEAPVLKAPAAAGTVKVYATVAGITFKNANDEAVNTTVSSDGDYIVYNIENASGIYTYSADGYGTGKFKAVDNGKIVLREINYTLETEGGCAFKIQVVNTEDSDLVYISEEDKLSVKLLIPVLGYNVRYKAYFEPTDDSYASFEVNLWVTEGKASFDGFKRTSYNLSDGGKYKMGKKTKVTFNIPKGAKLKVQQLVKFYRQLNEYRVTLVGEKDGFDVYEAYVSDDTGGKLQYEVIKDGYIKKAACFKASDGTITVDSLKTSEQFAAGDYNNGLITNGNYAKFIELNVGEAKDLWFSRAWQAIDTITSNLYMDPENHFYILEGDSVKIDEYGIVTGVKKGVSVIAMTYDAMEYGKDSYGAVDPDKIAVFVIAVGGSSDGVETGISIADLHTFYYVSSIKTAEGETRKDDSYSYTFTPTATNGENIEVFLSTVYGYPMPAKSEWKSVSKNSDGSYTANLKKGRNIIKVKAGDAEDYYVLHANETEVTVQNATTQGAKIQVNDIVKVSYTNIILGIPKLGAIYNPGYPDTTYLSGTAVYEDENTDDVIIEGEHNQYIVPDSVEFKTVAEGKVTISNLRIHSGSFGEAPNAHLALGLQSTGGKYTGGDSSEMTAYYSYIQDVEFEVKGHEHSFDLEVVDEKYLVSAATEWEPAKYYKSCRCGEKGTETFEYRYVFWETGSTPPTNLLGRKLETIKLLGVYGRILPESTETNYVIEVLHDTDRTKPIDVEMKALHYGKYNITFRTALFWVYSGAEKFKNTGILPNDLTRTITFTPEWDENGEASFQVMWGMPTAAKNNSANVTKYNITLKIHKHTFDRKVVDEKYLASGATCTEPAKYYVSCECGEKGTEAFEYGESLGHDYSGKWIYNHNEHWKKCTRCGEIADSHDHDFTDWSFEYKSTTDEYRDCKVCGYHEKATIIKIGENTTVKPAEENPNTGAPAMSMVPAVLVLAAAALVLKKHG